MELTPLKDFSAKILTVGSEINVVIGPVDPSLLKIMFDGPSNSNEISIRTDRDITWSKLLVILDCFPSIGEAKKNWHGPREIPCGLERTIVGKSRRIIIWTFKPFLNGEVSG